jgi:hypothetical protein
MLLLSYIKEENGMKILKMTSMCNNDFVADMICEHCGREVELTTGYNDGFYHDYVIPAMLCKGCNKNRHGGSETEHPMAGVMTI